MHGRREILDTDMEQRDPETWTMNVTDWHVCNVSVV